MPRPPACLRLLPLLQALAGPLCKNKIPRDVQSVIRLEGKPRAPEDSCEVDVQFSLGFIGVPCFLGCVFRVRPVSRVMFGLLSVFEVGFSDCVVTLCDLCKIHWSGNPGHLPSHTDLL